MKSMPWLLGVAVFSATTGLAGQNSSTRPTSESDTERTSMRLITVTGCVARITPDATHPAGTQSSRTDSAVGTSGAAGAERFSLTDAGNATPASEADKPGSSATAEHGSTSTGVSGAAAPAPHPPAITTSTYFLSGREGEVRAHVGHLVQMTGRVKEPVRTAADAKPQSKTSADTKPPTAAPAHGLNLEVESVRMVSESCGLK